MPHAIALALIGIFAIAISGALMAIRRDFYVVGIAILAVATALGGGIVRDLVLGDTPPPAFVRWEYLEVPLAAAVVMIFGIRCLAPPPSLARAAGLEALAASPPARSPTDAKSGRGR